MREDGGDDQGFLQGALSLTERKHDALEEGGGLVEGLLQSMVVVIIQLPSHSRKGERHTCCWQCHPEQQATEPN